MELAQNVLVIGRHQLRLHIARFDLMKKSGESWLFFLFLFFFALVFHNHSKCEVTVASIVSSTTDEEREKEWREFLYLFSTDDAWNFRTFRSHFLTGGLQFGSIDTAWCVLTLYGERKQEKMRERRNSHKKNQVNEEDK
jgi:hypothetical protein